MDIKERIMRYLDNKGMSPTKAEQMLGWSKGAFIKAKSISADKAGEFLLLFADLSAEWLLRGKGAMLKSDKTPQSTERTPITGNAIKYYPSVNGSMGGIEFLDNPDEFYTDIVLPGFSECKFAVNAFGDSMYPVIKSGQIVIMMQWTERFIDWGHIYMVVTKSGYRAIKYLKPSANEGRITCESESKESNPSFEIDIEDIHRLYLVKGWICKDAI